MNTQEDSLMFDASSYDTVNPTEAIVDSNNIIDIFDAYNWRVNFSADKTIGYDTLTVHFYDESLPEPIGYWRWYCTLWYYCGINNRECRRSCC